MASDVNTKTMLNTKDNSKMDFSMASVCGLATINTVSDNLKMVISLKLSSWKKGQRPVRKNLEIYVESIIYSLLTSSTLMYAKIYYIFGG
jgi:hypothetical protein